MVDDDGSDATVDNDLQLASIVCFIKVYILLVGGH